MLCGGVCRGGAGVEQGRRACGALLMLQPTATCARPGGVAVGRVQALRLNREGGCNAVLVGPHAPRGGVALAKEQPPRAVHGSAHGGGSRKLVML